MPSGTRANRRGQGLEQSVRHLLSEDYQPVSSKRFFALCDLEQPIFAEQVYIGEDVYGKRRRVDFILFHPRKWPKCLVIQCKWQASSGSVEEKYPFEVLSIQLNAYPTIVVLDGGGYSAGARLWLKGQAGKNRLRHVYDLGEISRFHSRGQL